MTGAWRGRYRVLERLGVGHFAEASLAELEGAGGFRRLVVLKRLREEMAQSDEHVTTFLEEASLVAQLRHPNIVQVLDLVEDEDGSYTMALELVDGPSLDNLVGYAAGIGIALPLEHGAFVVAEAARGLHFAHEARDIEGRLLGIVHRDVRPYNLLVSEQGEVKVSNFSIALSPSGRWTRADRQGYAAPEQLAREAADRRADVFSLGVILWELATGHRYQPNPESPRRNAPEPPSQLSDSPMVDARLDEIVERASCRDPSNRYPDAAAFAEDVRGWLDALDAPSGRVELARWMRDTCPDLGPSKLVPLGVNEEGSRVPTIVPPPPLVTNLPQHAELFGRESDLAAMDEAVDRGARLLVLHGPPGVGKTHLATHWARNRCEEQGAHGVFCSAENATDAAELARLVIGQLSTSTLMPQQAKDAALAAHDLLGARGRTVLVLDKVSSLEHLDKLLELWSGEETNTVVVVTSRHALDMRRGESLDVRPFDVSEPLSPEHPARRLFFASLGADDDVHERWRRPECASLVHRLLKRVGGHPLGIVFTASRAAVTMPAVILRELGSHTPPAIDVREVATALVTEVWSSGSPVERDAIRQCAMFQGTFGLQDAHAVLRIEGELEPVLRGLVERSLLEADGDLFRIPGTVRELCRTLPSTDAIAAARERHAVHILASCEKSLLALRGAGAARAFELLEKAEPDLRAIVTMALRDRDGDRAVCGALCLEPTFARRGDHRQLITMLELSAACDPIPRLAARGAMAEARAYGWLFDFKPALDAANRAVGRAKIAGDEAIAAEAQSELAIVEVRCGQVDDAADRYRDALEAMKHVGDRRGQGVVLLRLANLLSERDEAQAATMMYRLALEASRKAQDRVYEGIILSNLGAQLLDDGRPDQAHQALFASEEILRSVGETRYATVSRGLIGVSVMQQGDWLRGSATVEECIEVLRSIGEKGVIVFFLGVMVSAKARIGDVPGAQRAMAQMEALSARLKDTPLTHAVEIRRGHLDVLEAVEASGERDLVEARRCFASARRRAADAPRDVLTTLRIAASDLSAHIDEIEAKTLPRQRVRKRSSIGRLRLIRGGADDPKDDPDSLRDQDPS